MSSASAPRGPLHLPGALSLLTLLGIFACGLHELAGDAAWRSILLAPVLEEIVFRWGVQEALVARLRAGRRALAPLATAAVFAALHLLLAADAHDLPRAAATFFPAWWIGLLYHRHRALAPCIAWHAAFNLAWLAGLDSLWRAAA